MILVIDNYDSFTYNLVQYLLELGQDVQTKRNDEISIEQIEQLAPEYILISPGPCTPTEAGISLDVVRHFAGRVPILGVCLGHQSICEAFGGKIVRAGRLMHGKTSMIKHDGKGIFAGLENPFIATRYHSLVAEADSIPDCLEVSAVAEDDGEIMAVRHKQLSVVGMQFHPESILTDSGKRLLDNFLQMYGKQTLV